MEQKCGVHFVCLFIFSAQWNLGKKYLLSRPFSVFYLVFYGHRQFRHTLTSYIYLLCSGRISPRDALFTGQKQFCVKVDVYTALCVQYDYVFLSACGTQFDRYIYSVPYFILYALIYLQFNDTVEASSNDHMTKHNFFPKTV